MNMKEMLEKLGSLSEAVEKTATGIKHTAKPGGYGRKFDTDEEGDEQQEKKPEVKRGRGRPKKGADSDTGHVPQYSGAKDLQNWIIGNVPKNPSKELKKLPTTKHTLKDWIEKVDNTKLNEQSMTEVDNSDISDNFHVSDSDYMRIKGIVDKKYPGYELSGLSMDHDGNIKVEIYNYETNDAKHLKTKSTSENKQDMAEAEQLVIEPAKQNTQVIKQGTKTLGTVSNPQLAATIKQAIGKGEMSLAGSKLGEEMLDEKWAGDAEIKSTGEYAGKSVEQLKSMLAKLHKSGPHKEGSPEAKKQRQLNFALRAKGGWKKGEGAAKRKDMSEAERPSDDSDMGAGLGAGRSQTTLESRVKADDKAEKAGKKVTKDLEYDMDHKGKDDKKAEKAGKKVTKDIEYDEKKDKKKKVNESMHKHHAAKLIGKAHALAKEGYNCKYEDMDEAKAYHDGFKEGLDECYGMMPIRGVVVGEGDMPAATVPGMAGQAMPTMEDDLDEMGRSEWMRHKAKTTSGDTFKAFGQTMHDRDVLEMDSFAFESLDKQLNALLNESEQVDEGLSVSISTGHQGSPDSVSVTAQDAEAEKLMSFIKQVGLGGIVGSDASDYDSPQDSASHKHGEIAVVDDHDGMMAMMKKMAGLSGDSTSSQDYEDEEGYDHTREETCNECGLMETSCECDKEMVDEVETPDQMTDEVAEGQEEVSEATPQEAGAEEEAMTTGDEDAEAQEDMALAKADQQNKTDTVNEGGDGGEASEEDEEEISEQLDEWANDAGKDGTDQAFMRDIDFMTKVISGGLNKPKVTGQTTIPVIAGQDARTGTEDVSAWQKLAGIKK